MSNLDTWIPDAPVRALVQDLCRIPEIEALALAGSRGAGRADHTSDYDFYIYSQGPVPLAARKEVFARHPGALMELGNTFWEEEDDGEIQGLGVEFIYRSWDWIKEQVERTLVRHEAWVGYTTCFWANLLDSQILWDPQGRLSALKVQAQQPYPEALVRHIIHKNLPLLEDAFPNYTDQIAKALKREDWVSVQHRCAAYLASWFDILWALNRQPHPGEKRLVPLSLNHCLRAPKDWDITVTHLTHQPNPDEILPLIETLTQGLKALVLEDHHVL